MDNLKNTFRSHGRNTVRYFLILVALLAFLFFSNDFGLTDVQKTAIIMAVGVDKEEDDFVVTSQIAIPKSSKQGNSTETVQIVSKGKTIADAFKEINAKTGWYPKLVFCRLILLGEFSKTENVFDALDFFLRDEYLSDNCLVATCNGTAKELLNTKALVDPSGSVAMEKVLSAHAERVGTVLPSTLRTFSIGFFSESQSGFLPVLKTEPQQEPLQNEKQPPSSESSQSSESEESGESGGSGGGQGSGGEGKQEKPVFSASETALFVSGKWVETFTKSETFAFGAVTNDLKLAPYSVQQNEEYCTLNIRQNAPKMKLKIGENKRVYFKIELTLSAGMMDNSKSQALNQISDVGDVPQGLFDIASKKLSAEILQVFEKCRLSGCDLFGIIERLEKYEKEHFYELRNDALQGAVPEVTVRFKNVR